MQPPDLAQERRERLLAAKAALAQQIQYCEDRILALNKAPKRPLLSWDSDSDTSVVITPPPALREIHNEALQHLNTRLLATQELRRLQKLDIEVDVLKQRPDLPPLPAEEADTGAGVWRKVYAGGRTDIVPFQMQFYVYENKNGAQHYRGLTAEVVKTQHKAELQTTLSECQKPGLAIECISRYSCSYTERRNTLLELNEMYGRSLECETLESGGFRLSCGGIVLIDWILECRVMKPCRHRFRFQVADQHEIDDELYTMMKKAQQKLKEKDLSPEYRSRVLKKLIEICLGKFDLLPDVKSELDYDQVDNDVDSSDVKKNIEETLEKASSVAGKERRTKNTHVPKTNVTVLEDKRRTMYLDNHPNKKLKLNSGKEKVRNLDAKISVELKTDRILKCKQEVLKEKRIVKSNNDDCRQKTVDNKAPRSNKNKNEQNNSNKENDIVGNEHIKMKSDIHEHSVPHILQDADQAHKKIKEQSSLKNKCVNKKDVEVNSESTACNLPKVCPVSEQMDEVCFEQTQKKERSTVKKTKEQKTKIGTAAAKTNLNNKQGTHKTDNPRQLSPKSNELLREKNKGPNHSPTKTKKKGHKTEEMKEETKENKLAINNIQHDKIRTSDKRNVIKDGMEQAQNDRHDKQNVKENRQLLQMESKVNNIQSQVSTLSFKSQKPSGQLIHKTKDDRHISTDTTGVKSKQNTSTDVQKRKTSNSVRPNMISNVKKTSLVTKSNVFKTMEARLKSPIMRSKSSTLKPKSPIAKPVSSNINAGALEAKLRSPIMKPKTSIMKSKTSIVKPKSPMTKPKNSIINPKALEARPKTSKVWLMKPQNRPKSLVSMDEIGSKILGSIERNLKTSAQTRVKSVSNFGNNEIQKKMFRSKIPKKRTSPRVSKSAGEKKTFWASNSKH